VALQPQWAGPDVGLVVRHIFKTLAKRLDITMRCLRLVGSGFLRCPRGRLLRRLLGEEPTQIKRTPAIVLTRLILAKD
jgi:hypothetical protein